jgi:hypothetical protein
MVYCVVRFGRGQRNAILCGEFWLEGSVMIYCVVSVGREKRNAIFCVECWERAA